MCSITDIKKSGNVKIAEPSKLTYKVSLCKMLR